MKYLKQRTFGHLTSRSSTTSSIFTTRSRHLEANNLALDSQRLPPSTPIRPTTSGRMADWSLSQTPQPTTTASTQILFLTEIKCLGFPLAHIGAGYSLYRSIRRQESQVVESKGSLNALQLLSRHHSFFENRVCTISSCLSINVAKEWIAPTR